MMHKVQGEGPSFCENARQVFTILTMGGVLVMGILGLKNIVSVQAVAITAIATGSVALLLHTACRLKEKTFTGSSFLLDLLPLSLIILGSLSLGRILPGQGIKIAATITGGLYMIPIVVAMILGLCYCVGACVQGFKDARPRQGYVYSQ